MKPVLINNIDDHNSRVVINKYVFETFEREIGNNCLGLKNLILIILLLTQKIYIFYYDCNFFCCCHFTESMIKTFSLIT